MAETDTPVPASPKAPEPLTLDQRMERLMGPDKGQEKKQVEAKRKEGFKRLSVQAAARREQPEVKKALEDLVRLAGPKLNITHPEEMEKYLITEALQKNPNKPLLVSPEASKFFRAAAESQFGYTPKVEAPIYHLDAFREGLKQHAERAAVDQRRLQQLHASKTAPDAVYITAPTGEDKDPLVVPRWTEEDDVQKQAFDEIHSQVPGTATGNLTGLVIPKDLQLLQAQAYALPPEDVAAMGGEIPEPPELTAFFGSDWGGYKVKPRKVFVHQVPVSGGRTAINLHPLKQTFRYLYQQILSQEKGFGGYSEAVPHLSQEELTGIAEEADRRALSDIKLIQQQSRSGTLFIDSPEKLVGDIREGKDPLAYTSPIVQPAAALKNLGLISEGTYDTILKHRGPWASMWYPPSINSFNQGTLTYADTVEQMNPGTLHWLTNIDGLTVLGSYAFSPTEDLEYGSKEHLKETRGFDWGHHLGTAGKKLVELAHAKGTFAEKPLETAGTIAAFIAMFFSPDVATLATLPIGGAGKLGKMGSKAIAKTVTGAETLSDATTVLRLNRLDGLIEEANGKIASKEFTDSTQVSHFFKDKGAPELAAMYDMHLLSQTAGVLPTATKQGREFSPTFDGIRSRLAETRDEIQALEDGLPQEISQYISRYGAPPQGTRVTPAMRELQQKQLEASALEIAQVYATRERLKEAVLMAAAQRGLHKPKKADPKDIEQTGMGVLEHREAKMLTQVEEGRDAFKSLQEDLDLLGKWEEHHGVLLGYDKLTKNQKAVFSDLSRKIPQLKKQITQKQNTVRDIWQDNAVEAAYVKYEKARDVLDEKLIQLSAKLDLKSPQGINLGAKLRTAYQEMKELPKKYKAKKSKLKRNYKRAKTEETKLKNEKLLEELTKDFKLNTIAARKKYDRAARDFLKAGEDVPSLQKMGRTQLELLEKEAKAYVIDAAPIYMRNSLATIGDSIGVLRRAIQTRQAAAQTPIIDTGKFLKGIDPNDPTKVIFDSDAYTAAIIDKYIVNASEGLKATLQRMVTQSPTFIEMAKRSRQGITPVSGQELQELRNFEKILINQVQAEVHRPESIARALIQTWKNPPLLKSVLLGIDNTSVISWFKQAQEGGLRSVRLPSPVQAVAAVGGSVYRTARKVERALDPGKSRVGDYADGVVTSSKAAITRQSRANEELTLLSDQWVRGGQSYSNNLARYLTTSDQLYIQFRAQKVPTDGLGVGAPVIMNQGEFSPWLGFKQYILGLDNPAEALATKAVAYAFIPRNAKVSVEQGNQLIDELLNALGNLDKTVSFSKKGLRAQRALGRKYTTAELARLEYEELIRHMREKSKSLLGEVKDMDRTLAFVGKGILHGMVMNDYIFDLARASGIAMDSKDAIAANTVLTRVKGAEGRTAETGRPIREGSEGAVGAEYGFDPTGAFEALRQYGMRMDDEHVTTIARGLQRLEALTVELVNVNKMADPARAQAVSRALISKVEETAGKISKDLNATTAPTALAARAKQAFWNYLRLWRGNVILGTVLPRPAYFPNQAAGDASQIHINEGFISLRRVQLGKQKGKLYVTGSAPLMFQNAFTYIPYYGNWVQDYLLQRTKDATRSGRRGVLTTPLNATFNTTLTKLMNGGDEIVETKEGFRTLNQFLEEALEDGVFDTLMTDDLYKMMDRAGNNQARTLGSDIMALGGGLKNHQRRWGDLVTSTQGRQRLAFYAEYRLMRGEARTASKRSLHDTLYDWRHGVTDWEMQTIGQAVAFYPFFRLAMRQMQRAVLEGMTRPSLATFKQSMLAQTKLARLRNQGRLASTPSYIWGADSEEALNEEMIRQEVYRKMRPWWIGSRPVLSNSNMPYQDQVSFKLRNGRLFTHNTTVLPMWTALDMADLYMKLFQGVAGSMLFYGTKGQIRPTHDGNERLAKTLTDFLNPVLKAAAQGGYNQFTGNTGHHLSPKGMRVPLGQEDVFKMYSHAPFLGSMINIRPDERGYYVDHWAGNVIRALPVLGTDIPSYYAALYGANPKWEQGGTAGMAYFLRQITSIARQVPFNPEQDLAYNHKDVLGDFKKHRKVLEAQAGSRGGPGQDEEE